LADRLNGVAGQVALNGVVTALLEVAGRVCDWIALISTF
jgi:hypothetical protein